MEFVFYLVANEHPELLPQIKSLCKNERLRYKFYKINYNELKKIEKEKFIKYSIKDTFLVLNLIFNGNLSELGNIKKYKNIIYEHFKGVLPNSLVKLEFGSKFNQSIEQGVLPNSLVKLEFDLLF
tara:strand:+ start:225 stop:599 length:375 start_codon:yes stop_codon:yes gene_type:complete